MRLGAPKNHREAEKPSELLTIEQAANIFGVSKRTASRWVAAGEMPDRIPEGRYKKFDRTEIAEKARTDIVELITSDEAAKILGITIRTLRRWVAAGKMPTRIKKGKNKKFRRSDIQWLLDNRSGGFP